MIDIYRFLAFIDNLPDVRFVRDQEYNGVKVSIWDSYVTNKTVRIDTTDEEVSKGVAHQYLTLLGYGNYINVLFPSQAVVEKKDSEHKEKGSD